MCASVCLSPLLIVLFLKIIQLRCEPGKLTFYVLLLIKFILYYSGRDYLIAFTNP